MVEIVSKTKVKELFQITKFIYLQIRLEILKGLILGYKNLMQIKTTILMKISQILCQTRMEMLLYLMIMEMFQYQYHIMYQKGYISQKKS